MWNNCKIYFEKIKMKKQNLKKKKKKKIKFRKNTFLILHFFEKKKRFKKSP